MNRITSAPAENAKAVLVALCSNDASLRSRAAGLLKSMDALASGSGASGKKRKADSSVKICVKCQQPFYEEDNSSRACRYHSGVLDVDDDNDFWADHDEDCHGKIDTEDMRVEFPEGFVWDCCGKLGHRLGCTRGKHDADTSHRGRYGTKPSTFDCPSREPSDAGTSDLEAESGLEEEDEGDEGDR